MDKISNSLFLFFLGKSTIINTMRGLDARAAEAANVGITECTSTVNEYSDPKNPNLIYYDFLGVGTPKFPRDKYFENIKKVTKDEIEIQQYDFFLIISADRFTENDLWLAEQFNHIEKPFYFVRTKIDQSLDNEKHDYPEDYDENRILQKIRDNCYNGFGKMQVNKINHLDVQDLKVFLISGKLWHSMQWDFPSMVKSLTEDLPAIKRQAIIHSVHNLSKEIIRQKADLLRSNVWKMAMVSSLGGTVPIPFFSTLSDSYIINRYNAHFKATLGLDEESLKTIAQMHGCTFEQFSKHMLSSCWSQFFSCAPVLNAASVICDATEKGLKNAAEEGIKTAAEESIKIAATRIVRESGTGIIWKLGTGIRESLCTFHRELAKTFARDSAATFARDSATTIARESAVIVADFVPVIGVVVGATINYNAMKYRLNKLIGEMEEAAYCVLAFVKDSSIRKV
jgi:GTPase Era involved in 16S rRNA processing